MTQINPQDFLIKLNKNLNTLQEREAQYGGDVPLDLLNQIDDHKTAIALTEQVIAGELSEAEWREGLKRIHSEFVGERPQRFLKPLWSGIEQQSQQVGGVNLSDIEGEVSGEGDIDASVKAGGDVVGGDKKITYNQQGQPVETQYNVAGDLIINYPAPPAPTVTEADTPIADEPIPDNPYRGLFAFRPEHAHLFFGRESFTQKLVRATESRPFVTVLGASGSGKSSIVFAGLVPALLNQSSEPWLFTTFRPGDDPFLGLASALVPLYETVLSKTEQMVVTRKLSTSLQEGDLPLSDVLNSIDQTHPDHRLLIIADQFEELYTLCRDADCRQQFLNVLLTTIQSKIQNRPDPSG